MSRIVLTGATGTIGSTLCAALLSGGDQVVVLSRDPARARVRLGEGVDAHAWERPTEEPPPLVALADADAVVHLLGEPIAQRWSGEAKERIRDSRVLSTRQLVAALRDLPEKRRPATLLSQSAAGFYGPSDDRELGEASPPGEGFLAGVVRAWEREARSAEPPMRVATTRTGVVLSPHGGALAKMLPFFRAGVGGPVAGGRQFIPWIHLDDVVGALRFCLSEPGARGPINLAAPTPVSNAEFSAALGRVLRRPALLPVPALALRLLYGEMSEIVTTGQRVVPRRLLELGFSFRHPELEAALRDVLARG
jgi:uncharacterized protein (TIGR01777 family)